MRGSGSRLNPRDSNTKSLSPEPNLFNKPVSREGARTAQGMYNTFDPNDQELDANQHLLASEYSNIDELAKLQIHYDRNRP